MGILYIVATPIGNLQDITLRAIETLKKVDFILSEDTRKTGFLLEKILGHKVPKEKLASYYEQNELQRIPGVIDLLKAGYNVALVSDAGTPLVSDPGFKLVREARNQKIRVEAIPGPSAAISALSISGLPTDKFLFIGYLPKKPGNRSKLLNQVKSTTQIIEPTVILYEAPHRLVKTLEELLAVFGDIGVVMCREMTKIHEEYKKDKLSKLIAAYQKKNPKGEIVLLFNLKD